MEQTEINDSLGNQLNKTGENRMYDHLSVLFDYADKKTNEIVTQRSKNINYVLLIFAGLVGISFRFKDQHIPQLIVSVACFLLMLLYNFLDNRNHKYIHQWRKRRQNFTANKLSLIEGKKINNKYLQSDHEVDVTELNREQFTSPQRLIYHLLTFLSFLGLIGITLNSLSGSIQPKIINNTTEQQHQAHLYIEKALASHDSMLLIGDFERVSTAKTAAEIAVGVWSPIFGRKAIVKEQLCEVYRADDYWLVTGTFPKDMTGEIAYAIIHAKTGQVLHIAHFR